MRGFIDFLGAQRNFLLMIAFWLASSTVAQVLAFAVVPVTLFVNILRNNWAYAVFGLLFCLVFSDGPEYIYGLGAYQQVKLFYISAMAVMIVKDLNEFRPISQVFSVFIPFFIYAYVPAIFFPAAGLSGILKTTSYMLIYFVVPNVVLYAFREQGWIFLRRLMFVMLTVLVISLVMRFVNPQLAFTVGRFSGLFGNPNGLGIYSTLFFVLFSVVAGMRKDLFTPSERYLVQGVIVLCIVLSASRTSLAGVLIYITFNRFFSGSPFLGFVVLLAAMGVIDQVTNNLPAIILALGLQDYFRLDTLEAGSGRYFAWQWAWEKIQGFYYFGGGFGTDGYVEKLDRQWLSLQGHQGNFHNSYLTLWINVGLVGLIIYARSFILIALKAAKRVPASLAAMFTVLFSANYESWLVGSLNPFTIVLLILWTVTTEDDIVEAADASRRDPELEEKQAIPGVTVEG